MAKWKPHYDLKKSKSLIDSDKYIVLKSAKTTAFKLNFNEQRIKDALLNIRPSDFSKSEEDWQIKGHWQDAYKTSHDGHRLYVKWKITENKEEHLLVLSFKEDKEERYEF